jgi:translation initiation factor IF-2
MRTVPGVECERPRPHTACHPAARGAGGAQEMRVKGALVDHKEITAAMGVKVVAPGLESAVAGTSLLVVQPGDDEEELKDAVMEDMAVRRA